MRVKSWLTGIQWKMTAAIARARAMNGMVQSKILRRPILSTRIMLTHVKKKLVAAMIVPTATGLEKPTIPKRVEE